ncbi:hypothetical protein NEAUS04_0875 [Nematocida ausubeli]|nr:hypothetical protein NEAUS07_1951 [Nematocida ausubeli]KAI5162114.1 hypothetical protein NEAUS04_0875 [Nematocida ausubeli]
MKSIKILAPKAIILLLSIFHAKASSGELTRSNSQIPRPSAPITRNNSFLTANNAARVPQPFDFNDLNARLLELSNGRGRESIIRRSSIRSNTSSRKSSIFTSYHPAVGETDTTLQKSIKTLRSNCAFLKIFQTEEINSIFNNWEQIHINYLNQISQSTEPIVRLITVLERNTDIKTIKLQSSSPETNKFIEKIKSLVRDNALTQEDEIDFKWHISRVVDGGKEIVNIIFSNETTRFNKLIQYICKERDEIYKGMYFKNNMDKKETIEIIIQLLKVLVSIEANMHNNLVEMDKKTRRKIALLGIDLDKDIFEMSADPDSLVSGIERIYDLLTPGVVVKKLTEKMAENIKDSLIRIKDADPHDIHPICKIIISSVCKSMINDFIAESAGSKGLFFFGCEIKFTYTAIKSGLWIYEKLHSLNKTRDIPEETSRITCCRKSRIKAKKLFPMPLPSDMEEAQEIFRRSILMEIENTTKSQEEHDNNHFLCIENIECFRNRFENNLSHALLLSEGFRRFNNKIPQGIHRLSTKYVLMMPRDNRKEHSALFYRALTLMPMEKILIEENLRFLSHYALQVVTNGSIEQNAFKRFMLNPERADLIEP